MCEDPAHLIPIEKRTYDKHLKLHEFEKLGTTIHDDHLKAFLEQFSREHSQLTPEEQALVKKLKVKYQRLFAR